MFGHDDKEHRHPHISRALVRRIGGYAQPYVLQIFLLIALITLNLGVNLTQPLLFRDLLDNALPRGDTARLNRLALGLFGLPLLAGLIRVGQGYLGASVGENIVCDLRRAVYGHLQRMSMRFFTHAKTGEIMSRLNNDVGGAQQAVIGTIVNLVSIVISLVVTLGVTLSLEWRLTLIGVLILPLLVLPARRMSRVLRAIIRQQMDLRARMSTLMNERLNVSGALLVKIFGRADDELTRFGESAHNVRDISLKSTVIGRWYYMATGLVGAIGTAVVFWLGGHLVLRGAFTIGTIVAFSTYMTQLYHDLRGLTTAFVEFSTSLVSFERVFEVLDMAIEIDDQPGATALPRTSGHVRFENVWFSYTSGEKDPVGLQSVPRYTPLAGGWIEPSPQNGEGEVMSPQEERAQPVEQRCALREISFEMLPGQITALVGPSGAGKTTITYLVPRLYDPTKGQVRLDGHNLRDIRLASLTDNIGMVTQETYLFHDTVRANLLFAKPDATQNELEAACRVSNIHDLIAGLPEGYETVVGERGYCLSGGEKQRIAIARVVLKDPRVLILDEATSHLDSEGEALIQQALEQVMQGRTSLVIAHRLSTVLSADQILVLDRGNLVQQGTHQELVSIGGTYRDLYEKQFCVRSLETS